MIKIILWDFDGVIFDSLKIKGKGFQVIFKEYDSVFTNAMLEYHYKHGGISRFDKIRYFYKSIVCEDVSEDIVIEKANIFSNFMKKHLFNQKFLIEETINFISQHYQDYEFHIVSGAEENELHKLCDFLKLTHYFISIKGSPIKKEVLVKDILKKYNYNQKNTILIGDSINDYDAAKNNNIAFYGYNNTYLKGYGDYYIDSFKELAL